jgi:two-component system alkaline phosphatase synthesis response regulator PhoP
MSRRILLIEDEPGLVMTLTDRLTAEGYLVESAKDGESGLARALDGGFDLILLDLMLPRKNGLEVCRQFRQKNLDTPILMVTAKGQVVDKVVGLQLGADDYLTKPFDMMELLARMGALLRRTAPRSSPSAGTFQFDSVRVDFRRGEVTKSGEPVILSAREFQLLRYLVEHRGQTLSRDELLREVWGYQADTITRTLDVHITWLRQKLEDNPRYPRFLVTSRGVGYRFEA